MQLTIEVLTRSLSAGMTGPPRRKFKYCRHHRHPHRRFPLPTTFRRRLLHYLWRASSRTSRRALARWIRLTSATESRRRSSPTTSTRACDRRLAPVYELKTNFVPRSVFVILLYIASKTITSPNTGRLDEMYRLLIENAQTAPIEGGCSFIILLESSLIPHIQATQATAVTSPWVPSPAFNLA